MGACLTICSGFRIEECFDKKKIYSLDTKVSKFLGNVLKWLGYSPEYADCCDENNGSVENRLAITLSILKRTFPNKDKEYSVEELTLYGMVLHCASALTCNSDWLAEMLRILAYGEAATYYYDEFPPKFQPEGVKVKGKGSQNVAAKRQVKKSIEPTRNKDSVYDENVLLEIEIIRYLPAITEILLFPRISSILSSDERIGGAYFPLKKYKAGMYLWKR